MLYGCLDQLWQAPKWLGTWSNDAGLCSGIRGHGLTHIWIYSILTTLDGTNITQNTCNGVWNCQGNWMNCYNCTMMLFMFRTRLICLITAFVIGVLRCCRSWIWPWINLLTCASYVVVTIVTLFEVDASAPGGHLLIHFILESSIRIWQAPKQLGVDYSWLKEAFMAVLEHIAKRCREKYTTDTCCGGITLIILE